MKPRVLLSEGSSLSARQTLTVLGRSGYQVGICDPNPACLARFSRYAWRYHRCPDFNAQPLRYVEFLVDVAGREGYEVLLPVHEQAFVLARYRNLVPIPAALADFAAFQEVQGKAAFARLLRRLSLPQPEFRIADDVGQAAGCSDFPYYLKLDYGTAGQSVWHIADAAERRRVLEAVARREAAGDSRLVIQKRVDGELCQVQAVFDNGRLLARHCTRTRGASIGGGHAARESVDHPMVGEHLRTLGEHLRWHGPLALDYIHPAGGSGVFYLEANPRLVEPMNACLAGVNFPELTIRVACGHTGTRNQAASGTPGIRTHSLMALLLGLAAQGGSRRTLLKTIGEACAHRGTFEDSREDLTPLCQDAASAIPFALVLARLLVNPRRAGLIGSRTVGAYSLRAGTIARLQRDTGLQPRCLPGLPRDTDSAPGRDPIP